MRTSVSGDQWTLGMALPSRGWVEWHFVQWKQHGTAVCARPRLTTRSRRCWCCWPLMHKGALPPCIKCLPRLVLYGDCCRSSMRKEGEFVAHPGQRVRVLLNLWEDERAMVLNCTVVYVRQSRCCIESRCNAASSESGQVPMPMPKPCPRQGRQDGAGRRHRVHHRQALGSQGRSPWWMCLQQC
jgi:hypothetical protein